MRPAATFGLLLGATGATAAPLAHTYSIVARDPGTGQLGVAVQSHWPGVGAMVCWARAGVGAVATQAWTRSAYGPACLDALAEGADPAAAYAGAAAADPRPEVRQVGLVDARGRAFAHTGAATIPDARHQLGEGYAVQANMMADASVVPAMAAAFEAAEGPLAERLLAALAGAQAAGGDVRGKQAAGLLVVAGEASGDPMQDVVLDLRVDDHPTPVAELRRLLDLRRAYDLSGAGQVAAAAGDHAAVAQVLERLEELAPRHLEPRFWVGVALLQAGHRARARAVLGPLVAADPAWAECLRRLPGTSAFPGGAEGAELVEAALAAPAEGEP